MAVAKELKLKAEVRGENTYVTGSINNGALSTKEISIQGDKVPNVRGLSVKDAIYLLEERGLTVKISGKGKVIKQSLSPGSKVIKGKQIEIILG